VDDYDEFGLFHNITGEYPQNLDILASPEVQEILNSQWEYDQDTKNACCENTMVVQELKDTILEGGYDSDCEELTLADWEQCGSQTTSAVVEENRTILDDTADAAIDK